MRDTFFLRRGEGQRSKKEEDTSFRLLPRGSTTLHDVKRLKELTEAGAARTVSLCRHDDAAKIVVYPSVHVDRLIPHDIQALEAPLDQGEVRIELVRRQQARTAKISHQNSSGSVRIRYEDDGSIEMNCSLGGRRVSVLGVSGQANYHLNLPCGKE